MSLYLNLPDEKNLSDNKILWGKILDMWDISSYCADFFFYLHYCYKLNYVSTSPTSTKKNRYAEVWIPGPQNVASFRNKIFAEVKLKWGHECGP